MMPERVKSLSQDQDREAGVRICNACGGKDLVTGFSAGQFLIKACKSCGLKVATPIPTEHQLQEYYAKSYSYSIMPIEECTVVETRLLDEIAALKPSGKLLEIGCGKGFLLRAAKQIGFSAQGVELSPTSAEAARKNAGVPVFCGTTEEYLQTGKSHMFDVVIARHCIEHLRDPRATLCKIGEMLAPGGMIAIVVPNSSSLASRLFGRYWEWMCPPAHLFHFSPKSLNALLASLQFEKIKMRTRRGDARNLYLEALVATAKALGGNRWLRTKLGRSDKQLQSSELVPDPPRIWNRRHIIYRVLSGCTELIYILTYPLFFLSWCWGLGEELEAFGFVPVNHQTHYVE